MEKLMNNDFDDRTTIKDIIMKTKIKQKLKNRINFLDADEIEMPMKPITAFFDAAWLPQQLEMLKDWRNDVSFELSHPIKGSPSDRLYDYELTMKLIEAAWLIRKKTIGKLDIENDENNVIKEWCIKNERKQLRDYPNHLEVDEIINPATVIKKFFKTNKLRHYNSILRNWLYDALSHKYMEESLSKEQIIPIYENLICLFEATWLISERNKLRP